MLGVISNILAFLTTTRFGATSTLGSANSKVKHAWVEVVPGWVTPSEVSHQVAKNKSVRYTLVKSRGKADNIVIEVGGMLHKKWHDKRICHRELREEQHVLLFNSRLKLFSRKLKTRWSEPF